jgi:hypothetical protein
LISVFLIGFGQPSLMNSDRMIQLAREIVDGVDKDECRLRAACIVSSGAAGDFTPASDVDILMLASEGEGESAVRRRLIEGKVFEWMIIGREDLGDADAILQDAGLTHDLLTAIILKDEGGWLTRLQSRIASQHHEPERIWSRTTGQLDCMRRFAREMSRRVDEGQILMAQRSHVAVLKAVFALPRAILNKRCTMSRGLLFCREAALELGWTVYVHDAIELLGVEHASRAFVTKLDALSRQIIAESTFTDDEKAIRIHHLWQSKWLLDHAEPSDAVWPLYFWSSTNVQEGGDKKNQSSWRHWIRFVEELGIADISGLRRKAILAGELLHSATDLAEEYGSLHGLCPKSSHDT